MCSNFKLKWCIIILGLKTFCSYDECLNRLEYKCICLIVVLLNFLDTKVNPTEREREREREREKKRERKSPKSNRKGCGREVRWCWVNFQCRGVLLNWIVVGQGPIVFAVGADGRCLDSVSLVCLFSFLFYLWETIRYRLKYCLKGSLNLKQLTNQIQSWVVWEHLSIAATMFTLKFWTKCVSKYRQWSDYSISFYDSGISFTTLFAVWNLQNSFPAGSFPRETGYTF